MGVFSHSHPVVNNRLLFQRRAYLLPILLIMLATSAVQAAGCDPAPSGLVGWWPAEGNANDIVGTNNGTLKGGATASAPGVVGSAFQFDGTNGYVQIPDSPVFHPTNLTVEAWVLCTLLDTPALDGSYLGQQYIVFKQNSRYSQFEGFELSKDRLPENVGTNDTFCWEVTSSGGQLVFLESVTTITTNVWYYVVGVRGSNYLQLYINGRLEAQTAVSFPQNYGNFPLYFGTSGQSYWDHRFAGKLDEVSLYNRALSSNEVAALYASGSAGKCKAPAFVTQPSGQNAYWGSSVTFTSVVTGVNPLAYNWQNNGGVIPGATNSMLQLTNLQMTNAGNYVVLVTNVVGSVTSNPALLDMKVADVSIALDYTQNVAALTLNGVSNNIYGIQFSSNLVNWVGLTNLTFTAPTNVWLDLQVATQAMRFYRVGKGPIPIP